MSYYVDNYASFLQLCGRMEKARGLDITESESLQEWVSQLTCMVMFLNDQIYNQIVELETEMKAAGVMKFEMKKNYNELRKYIENYNLRLFGKIGVNADVFADITLYMEKEVKPSIDILMYQISQELLNCNISGAKNHIASRLLLINLLQQGVKGAVNSFKERIFQSRGYYPENMDPLLLKEIEYLSFKMSEDLIVTKSKSKSDGGGVTLLVSSEKIMTAFKVMTNKVVSKELYEKAVEPFNGEEKEVV